MSGRTLADLYRLKARLDEEIALAEAALHRARTLAREAGLRRRPARAAECGTDSGYYNHLRVTRTPACQACKLAHAAAEKARKDRKRVAA